MISNDFVTFTEPIDGLGYDDIFVSAFDRETGEWAYDAILRSSGDDHASAVAVDSDSNVIIAGSRESRPHVYDISPHLGEGGREHSERPGGVWREP